MAKNIINKKQNKNEMSRTISMKSIIRRMNYKKSLKKVSWCFQNKCIELLVKFSSSTVINID